MQQKAELKPAFQLLHSFQGWQKNVALGSSQHKLEAKIDSMALWGEKSKLTGQTTKGMLKLA